MKTILLFMLMLSQVGAQPTATDGTVTMYTGKGVIVRAPKNANWCNYGVVRLEPAVFELETLTPGAKNKTPSCREQALAKAFLEQLNTDLITAFAELGSPSSPKTSRTMVAIPKLSKLSLNNPWINVIGLAAMQLPLKGSGLALELALSDSETAEALGSVLLVGKGFLARQVDVKRYRYSFSRLGQAQEIAKAGSQEAARQISRLMGCDASKPKASGPSVQEDGVKP
jgi:hypothetical protein